VENGVEHPFIGLFEKVPRPPEYLEALYTKLASDPPHQQQDDHNQKNQSKSTAGIVSPAFTVRPSGQCADEDEYQNNDQYRTHVFLPFFLLLFLKFFTPKTSCLSESWLWCIMQLQPGAQGHAGA
jgi:hypothetical protein